MHISPLASSVLTEPLAIIASSMLSAVVISLIMHLLGVVAQECRLEGDGGDQIPTSSVSSIQAASIWATTPQEPQTEGHSRVEG